MKYATHLESCVHGAGGEVEDRLKAELRANFRASRSESRVEAAGGGRGRPPEGGTPSKCTREPSKCTRDQSAMSKKTGRPRGNAGGRLGFEPGAGYSAIVTLSRANLAASGALGTASWTVSVPSPLSVTVTPGVEPAVSAPTV